MAWIQSHSSDSLSKALSQQGVVVGSPETPLFFDCFKVPIRNILRRWLQEITHSFKRC